MIKQEEIVRYKQIDGLRPITKPLNEPFSQRKTLQPIVHTNTKIDKSDLKYTDIQSKKIEEHEQRIAFNPTFKKLPFKSYRQQRQRAINEIKRTKLENFHENKRNVCCKNAERLSLYEIKSYQLFKVCEKETEMNIEILKRKMDLCRKTAKKAAAFFYLAKVHKSKQASNPYVKFMDKIPKKPGKITTTLVGKSKLPALESDEPVEMMDFLGIDVSTQTEKAITRFAVIKKYAMSTFLSILLLSNIFLLLALGLNINCKLNDPFPLWQFWQKLHDIFYEFPQRLR